MDPNRIVKLNGRKYLKERFLGKGGFGHVDMVRLVCIIPTLQGRPSIYTTDPAYALKTIDINPSLSSQKAMAEVNILKSCNHPHIIRLFDAVAQPSSVLILMEYCEGGNLNSRLARPSDTATNLRLTKELADAIYYSHSNSIVHRDLKPENVLLTANDSIKLGDFGLARVAPLSFFMDTAYMTTVCGTLHWMAPEVFDGHYTEKADIFSLGLIFYVILTRTSVDTCGQKYFGAFFNVNGKMMGLGEAMKVDPRYMVTGLDQLPFSMGNLIRPMLDYNPNNRPSAQCVLQFVESVLQHQAVMRAWNNFFYYYLRNWPYPSQLFHAVFIRNTDVAHTSLPLVIISLFHAVFDKQWFLNRVLNTEQSAIRLQIK